MSVGDHCRGAKVGWFKPFGLRFFWSRHLLSMRAMSTVECGTIFYTRNFLIQIVPYRHWTFAMPLTRPIRRFYLTPPSVPLFIASLVIAILAALVHYGHLSLFKSAYAFIALMIAYLIIVIGVMFRGV
jgi:hypothetical protein